MSNWSNYIDIKPYGTPKSVAGADVGGAVGWASAAVGYGCLASVGALFA